LSADKLQAALIKSATSAGDINNPLALLTKGNELSKNPIAQLLASMPEMLTKYGQAQGAKGFTREEIESLYSTKSGQIDMTKFNKLYDGKFGKLQGAKGGPDWDNLVSFTRNLVGVPQAKKDELLTKIYDKSVTQSLKNFEKANNINVQKIFSTPFPNAPVESFTNSPYRKEIAALKKSLKDNPYMASSAKAKGMVEYINKMEQFSHLGNKVRLGQMTRDQFYKAVGTNAYNILDSGFTSFINDYKRLMGISTAIKSPVLSNMKSLASRVKAAIKK